MVSKEKEEEGQHAGVDTGDDGRVTGAGAGDGRVYGFGSS